MLTKSAAALTSHAKRVRDRVEVQFEVESNPLLLAPSGFSSAPETTYSDALQPRGEHVACAAPKGGNWLVRVMLSQGYGWELGLGLGC